MRIIAFITDPPTLRGILGHPGEPTRRTIGTQPRRLHQAAWENGDRDPSPQRREAMAARSQELSSR
jgi:hypothetical protein